MGELAIVFGVCLVCEGVVSLLPFAFPASVLSMLVLLGLLLSGILKERHIGRVCTFFVGNMAFFFLPSCVGLLEHWGTLSAVLIPFFIVSALTTPLVYAVTAWTIQLLMARRNRKEETKGPMSSSPPPSLALCSAVWPGAWDFGFRKRPVWSCSTL